jgi:signal transduction histidine kinase
MLAPYRSGAVTPYLVGLLGVAVATGLRQLLHPVLGDHLSFSFHLLAVFVAGWTGGLWPAAVTAVLSALVSNYLFTDSIWITSNEEGLEFGCFVLLSLIIASLSEISLRALHRARAAEREKDNFMAAVAHEMRSPLSVIYYTNTLRRMNASDASNDRLDVIDRQVSHLNLMIEDLLDVSRAARGKLTLHKVHADVAQIVSRAVERANPLIETHHHSLKVALPENAIELYVDSPRMEQVVTNLLTNAAKYTPDGGEIAICASEHDGTATISVRDNGIGIAKEALRTVFELFVQAEAGRDRADGGLGIGLAIARKIVDMHGGTVRAVSGGKNRGSEFVVSLPVEQPAPQQVTLAGV